MLHLSREFPHLTEMNHRITSPPSPDYNCIAWSTGDSSRWWQPGVYWPVDALPNECSVGTLAMAFAALGFQDCGNASLESGFEKVALYGESEFYTHAARQLPTGRWTSKLGRSEDIEHDTPDVLAGGLYGSVIRFMKRRLATA